MTPSKPPPKVLRHLAENSQTLHCRYPLPPNPAIIYAKFSPENNLDDPYKFIEKARQSFIRDIPENDTSLVGSLLPFVNISNGIINLWVFCIRSQNFLSASIQASSPKGKEKAPSHLCQELETITFEGLQRVDLSDFTPNDLFSCSAECAALTRSCPACARSANDEISWPPTSAVLLPRSCLRDAYSMFICAVRERLVDNICSPNPGSMTVVGADIKSPLQAVRFGQGFLTIEECPDSLWGYGWERNSQSRHLIHTALDVYLTPTAIYIRPMPTVTKLLPTSPLPSKSSAFCAPLSPGTPLVLAPYPTPAFYISTHASSTVPSSLRNEFWEALKGLGALRYPRNAKTRSTSHSKTNTLPESKFSDEPFVLVYISLNNPQGEPRGLPALWPAHLTFVDTDPNRIRLTTLPEIPGLETLLTPPRPSINAVSDPGSSIASSSQALNRTIFRNSSKRLRNTQRVMRTLELHSRRRIPRLPIHEAAKSTAGYVESVAKEREREREKANLERLRREKEGKDKTPSASSTSGSVPSQQTSTPAPPTPTIPGAVIPPKSSQDTATSISSWRSTSGRFFARTAQDSISYSFYPSPPDSNPFHVSSVAGAAESASGAFGLSSVSVASAQYTSTTLAVSDNIQTSAMAISNEMDLGMDIDLNDINIGINLSRSMNMMDVNGDSDLVDVDGGFGGFGDTLITDDDFDYFDKSIVPEPSPLDKGIPSWLCDALTSDGIIPSILPSSQQFRSSLEPEDIISMVAPELLPSTPTARSPPTPDNPRTPSLEILNPLGSPRNRSFDPIYFGDRHHVADDKYTGSQGKYLLSNLQSMTTPPPDDVAIGRKRDGWRFRYDVLTDPRIGVVNRLRGLKRKLDSHSQNTTSLKRGLREEEWESMFGEEDDAEEQVDSSSSCDEDDEELDTMELDCDRLDVHSRESFSRPSTPPPVGHPLSPSLLYFQLEYSLLLPLGVAMRPSFKELVSSETPSVAISVPTPVSPAAALGSASERNKTLEMLAQAMSKENVENNLWSHACGLTPPFSSPRFSIPQDHINRLSALFKRIPGVEAALPLSALLDIPSDIPPPSVFSSPKLKLLSQPKFSLGRAGLVHHILPPAIRFWEKEGLGPRGGTKDVVAFCLFQDGEEKATIVTSWLERVARTYAARGLGTHVPGDAGPFTKGLVPLQFESVRKVLAQLMATLSLIPHTPRIVVYIIAPPSLCSSLDSPTLRSIIRSRKYAPKLAGQRDFDNDRVLFHFVPESYIADPYVYPCTRYLGLEQFVQSVYDRLLRACNRPVPSRSSMSLIHVDNRLQAPAFVLARPGPPETHFQWEGRPSLNVLDRHTFLHVGYRLSNCKKWLLAACIDERGEAHDLAVWNIPYHSEDDQTVGGHIDVNTAWIVENIWLFTSQFAKRSDTEWKIVLSRFDGITASEVEAWMVYLETAVMNFQGRPLHVSLVCAQNDIPLALASGAGISQGRPFSAGSPGSVFVDASSLTYSVSFPGRAPIILTSHLYPTDQPSILGPSPTETDMDTADDDTDTQLLPIEAPTPVIPLCTSSLFTVPNACNETTDAGEAMGDSALLGALYIHMLYICKTPKSTLRKGSEEVLADITQSWYDLSVLTKERWRIPDGNWNGNNSPLPFHLAALDVMLAMLVTADTPKKEVGSV